MNFEECQDDFLLQEERPPFQKLESHLRKSFQVKFVQSLNSQCQNLMPSQSSNQGAEKISTLKPNLKKNNSCETTETNFFSSNQTIGLSEPQVKQTIKPIIVNKSQFMSTTKSKGRLKSTKGKKKEKVGFHQEPFQKSRRPSIQTDRTNSDNFQNTIRQITEVLSSQRQQKLSSALAFSSDQSLLNGYTEKQFDNGVHFKGLCVDGSLVKGELKFDNNYTYDGAIKLNKFHGFGKLRLPKGHLIEANWFEGSIVGKVTMRYPKGQIYVGDVHRYKRHGCGKLTYPDGSYFEGQFSHGQISGFGCYRDNKGKLTTGYWLYGEFISNHEEVYLEAKKNKVKPKKKKSQKKISSKKTLKSIKQFQSFVEF